MIESMKMMGLTKVFFLVVAFKDTIFGISVHPYGNQQSDIFFK
jgi:hypothetical protein